MISRALKYALAGAVIGGVAAWFMFGRGGYNASSGNYGWWAIMTPTFALIGAVVGLLDFALVSGWRAIGRGGFDAADSARNQRAGLESEEWNNPSNWTAGIFYKSRVDRRIFV